MATGVRTRPGQNARTGNPTTQARPRTTTVSRAVGTGTGASLAGAVGTGTSSTLNPLALEAATGVGASLAGALAGAVGTTQEKKDNKFQNPNYSDVQNQPPKEAFKEEVGKPTYDFGQQQLYSDEVKQNEINPESPEYVANISQYRPEIISLTKFDPLYDENGNLTKYGELFEALIETLRKADVDARNFLKSNPEEQQQVLQIQETLKNSITDLNSKVLQLSSFIKFFSSVQKDFDVNSEKYTFSPQEYFAAYSGLDSYYSNYDSLEYYVSKMPQSLSLNSTLNEILSYEDKPSDIKKDFFSSPSTRSWVILIEELKQLILSHSRKKMKEKLSKQNPVDGGSHETYPDLKVSNRITVTELINNFGKSGAQNGSIGNDQLTGIGQARFRGAYDVLATKFENPSHNNKELVSTILYVLMKEVRQRACLKINNLPIDLPTREAALKSLTISQYQPNYFIHQRFSSDPYVGGAKLYDVGVFGRIVNRTIPIFALDGRSLPSAITGRDYFFRDFGTEEFFSGILSNQGISSTERIKDYLDNSLRPAYFQHFLTTANSGILPINDSKISTLLQTTDPVKFFEKMCSKFIDNEGLFLTTKDYISNNGQYVGAGSHDLDALMFFGLASGHPTLKTNMKSIDLPLKNKAVTANTYRLDTQPRDAEQNVALMKNALHSYIINRINNINDDTRQVNEIYSILTNIADVVGGGLVSNDDYSPVAQWFASFFAAIVSTVVGTFAGVISGDPFAGVEGAVTIIENAIKASEDPTIKHFGIALQEGEQQSVIISQDTTNMLGSDEEKFFVGPTHENAPAPRFSPASDEVIKWGLFSIQPSDGVAHDSEVDSTASKDPAALEDIRITLKSSPLIDTIVEIMTPIVNDPLTSDFSHIFFDIICNSIGTLAPFKEIKVYIDDYAQYEPSGAGFSAGADGFESDYEMKSALVFFTKFYNSDQKFCKERALLYKNEIIKNIIDETNSLTLALFTVGNILSKAITTFDQVNTQLQTFQKDISSFFALYLQHPKKFALLFKEQQFSLMASSVKDVVDSFNDFSLENNNQTLIDQTFNRYLSGMSYSPKVVSAMRSFFKKEEYCRIAGYNKQILTVGLPLGLLRELNGKLQKKLTFNNPAGSKENDIFKILLYKIDLLNDDIVYLPQEFLFETSRFPVKTYSKISDVDITANSFNFEENLFKIFPTRDYKIFSSNQASQYREYKPTTSVVEAFASDDYKAFLNQTSMSSILKNHITSLILENYLKVLSGLEFNESSFLLDEPIDVSKAFFSLYNEDIFNNPESWKLFNRNIRVNSFAYISNLISPKKFDRVFNIIFDPDSFFIDQSKSDSKKLQKLKNSNRIKEISYQEQTYYIDVDKNFRDPTLNSYFVNVETLSIPEVQSLSEDTASAANQAGVSSKPNANPLPNFNPADQSLAFGFTPIDPGVFKMF